MKLKFFSLGSALALLVVAAACAKSPAQPTPATGSSQPTTATSSTDSTGVTLVSPALVSPASLAQITNVSQPITLVINNGLSTGKATPTYTFEVASDNAFASKVYAKDGVAQGANGQTSLTIDKLGAGKSYFWRARTNSGSAAGLYSSVRGFTIGPEVILQAPVLGDPAPNADGGRFADAQCEQRAADRTGHARSSTASTSRRSRTSLRSSTARASTSAPT